MKHLVTIMVDGHPMTASIRIGDDAQAPSDTEMQTQPEETEEEITAQEALDIITGSTA